MILSSAVLRNWLCLAMALMLIGCIGSESTSDPTVGSRAESGSPKDTDKTFTLRLIAYGLNALVPEDTTSPKDGIFDNLSILPMIADKHNSRLGLLRGECKSGSALCQIGHNKLDLDWNLNESSLEGSLLSFSGAKIISPPISDLGLRVPGPPASFRPSGAGPWDWQWAGWPIHADKNQKALAFKSCKKPWNCKNSSSVLRIASLLKLEQVTSFGTCHLAHKEEKSKPKEDKISTFVFNGHSKSTARAIADAFVMEISMVGEKAPELELTATPKTGSPKTVRISAVGLSSKHITLILSTNDYESSTTGPNHAHFKHYYGLTGETSTTLKHVEDQKKISSPGICEEDIVTFEYEIGANNGAHNQRECDSAVLAGWEP